MDEENIKDILDAYHQHLQSQEREQKFVEEENYRADAEIRIYILTPEEERIEKREEIRIYILTVMQERIEKREEIRIYILTPIQERLQESKEILEDIRTPEEERIQEKEKILEDIRTREQERIQRRQKILEDIRTREQERIQRRQKILEDIRTREQERIQRRQKILEDIRTPMQERLQKSKDKTTKTTKSRHSAITSGLLGSVFFASRICSVGADFIPVESDLSLCKTDLSKLADTCDQDEGNAIHCVLNDKGELGIGCFVKTWVKQGYCPYFRKSFGVLDIRPCLGNSSICPRDQYLSNEVYKYPGCLINNSTRVLDKLTIQTTESTTLRSSDAGDEESMLRILVVILGLITLSLLLIHGLRFLRSMNITSRGLRSAYVPASMGHQDPHDLPDDDVDV